MVTCLKTELLTHHKMNKINPVIMYLSMQMQVQQRCTHSCTCTHRYHSKQLLWNLPVRTLQSAVIPAAPFFRGVCNPWLVPVDAGALDAQQNAQVDAGPAGIWLPTVAALVVAGDALHSL